MDINGLYGRKGEIVTRIELLQNELAQVNQAIVAELQKKQPVIPEVVK